MCLVMLVRFLILEIKFILFYLLIYFIFLYILNILSPQKLECSKQYKKN